MISCFHATLECSNHKTASYMLKYCDEMELGVKKPGTHFSVVNFLHGVTFQIIHFWKFVSNRSILLKEEAADLRCYESKLTLKNIFGTFYFKGRFTNSPPD